MSSNDPTGLAHALEDIEALKKALAEQRAEFEVLKLSLEHTAKEARNTTFHVVDSKSYSGLVTLLPTWMERGKPRSEVVRRFTPNELETLDKALNDYRRVPVGSANGRTMTAFQRFLDRQDRAAGSAE